MELVNRSQVGRIYSGRPQAVTSNRLPIVARRSRDEDEVLVAPFDIPTNVLERVSAQV
jgi:hypothetical protein